MIANLPPHVTIPLEGGLIPIDTTREALEYFGLRSGHTVNRATVFKLADYELSVDITRNAIRDAQQFSRVAGVQS